MDANELAEIRLRWAAITLWSAVQGARRTNRKQFSTSTVVRLATRSAQLVRC